MTQQAGLQRTNLQWITQTSYWLHGAQCTAFSLNHQRRRNRESLQSSFAVLLYQQCTDTFFKSIYANCWGTLLTMNDIFRSHCRIGYLMSEDYILKCLILTYSLQVGHYLLWMWIDVSVSVWNAKFSIFRYCIANFSVYIHVERQWRSSTPFNSNKTCQVIIILHYAQPLPWD